MYCPEHNEYYAQEENPFANSVCGYCGTRKPSHYQKEYDGSFLDTASAKSEKCIPISRVEELIEEAYDLGETVGLSWENNEEIDKQNRREAIQKFKDLKSKINK